VVGASPETVERSTIGAARPSLRVRWHRDCASWPGSGSCLDPVPLVEVAKTCATIGLISERLDCPLTFSLGAIGPLGL
jgi:hypothetical protein